MTVALYIAALWAPLLMPCLAAPSAVALAVRIRTRTWGRAWYAPDTAPSFLLALMTAAAAFGLFGYGVACGFYILDPDQMCAAQGVPGDRIVTHETLPVSAQCVTEAGAATELVPSWVNPTICLCLLVCAASVTAGAASLLRRREMVPADPAS
ncbi:hypothetical protein E5082_16555 [Streptomyces griseoluteus]|uniref:Uncharacterized protein n=1 Tax=Streptomyces griseoluteus TaxID=29306 RepID=A0A4Z1DL59_STRGP|nr:hypothetical protein [Streptomyces griseoluteus]TGN83187.1 hypothetical protein E5082_16555 [Streptomyces griseoluteus]GHF18649.1 hypothetical protein GCM10017776_40650 [Streptomyces griseoluteus]